MAKPTEHRGEAPGKTPSGAPDKASGQARCKAQPSASGRGRYSVHELAGLSGVSVRTLHHYDSIGLLCPHRADNNYRVYGQEEVDRLQQILLYREVGLGLADIKALLDDASFDAEQALADHLARLVEQRERTDRLIASVEKTLAHRKGAIAMGDHEKFEGFKRKLVEENEKKYGKEARAAYGDDAVDASNAKMMGMTEEQYTATQGVEAAMKEELLAAMEEGDPAGPHARKAADLHRQWLTAFWKEGQYSKQAHKGLAEMYVADERFKQYYDAIAPGAAEFLRDAIAAYCS